MQVFFETLDNIADLLAWITLKIVIILTGFMTITVLVGVFFRYVLVSPLGWTETLSRYTMVWAALLAVSVCIKDNEHVGLTFLVRSLPLKAAKVLNFIIGLIILFFLYELTKRGYRMAISGWEQQSLALGISMFWPLLSVPVSGALSFIQQVLHMIRSFNPEKDQKDIFGATEVEQALDDAGKYEKISVKEES